MNKILIIINPLWGLDTTDFVKKTESNIYDLKLGRNGKYSFMMSFPFHDTYQFKWKLFTLAT